MGREHYAALKSIDLGRIGCSVPSALSPPAVQIDSPAVLVMTDMARVPPACISSDAAVPEANRAMLYRGVRLLFVTNGDQELQGIVTAHDVLGERPVLVARQQNMKREELRVGDIMTPLEQVEALPMPDVQRAEVGHIVATLKASGRQHAIVIEPGANGHQQVRGIFSLSQIARQLGIPITTSEIARNFAEIEAVIAGV